MPENNSPNLNIVSINEIEGLVSQINEKLGTLNYDNSAQLIAKSDAVEGLSEWSEKDLFRLRKAFE